MDKWIAVFASLLGVVVGFLLNFWRDACKEKKERKRNKHALLMGLYIELKTNKSLLENNTISAPSLREQAWITVYSRGVLREIGQETVRTLEEFYFEVFGYNQQVSLFLADPQHNREQTAIFLRRRLAPKIDSVIQAVQNEMPKEIRTIVIPGKSGDGSDF